MPGVLSQSVGAPQTYKYQGTKAAPPEQATHWLLPYLPAQSCCLPHVPSVPSANRDRNCQHFLSTYCAPGTIPSTLRELTHLLPKPHGICWRERNALAQIPTWFLLPISSYAVKLT